VNTSTEKLVMALRVMAAEIQSDDGVANAALHEAALRLEQLSEKVKRLYEGILKQNQEIEQTCGKVLGYPWFKDDQKNFPGATEKDGVCVGDHVAETIVSELAKRHTEALARIKRLEEAGDFMAYNEQLDFEELVERWRKAKEAKLKASEAWHEAKEAKP